MICPNCGKEIEPIEPITFETAIQKDKTGRVIQWTELAKDTLTGKRISKRVDRYSYYRTGEINTIDQIIYGTDDLHISSKQQIKHYRDARSPSVTAITKELNAVITDV
jgi:hypothetical protein